MNKRSLLIELGIVIIAALLFLPGLGGVRLFDWDEINFAESAREMLMTGDWLNVQINFETFWEKPPLFIWIQALSMSIFGVNEFAARLPNAIVGIITLLVLFRVGKKLSGERFGLLWAALYASSIFPFFYFKSGIIDPWFNLFIFLGIYFFSKYVNIEEIRNRMLNAILSAAFIGLAILTKGPVALLIFLLTFIVYLIWKRFKFDFRWKDVFAFIGVLAVVGGAWFILQIATGNFSIIQDFIEYQIRLFRTEDADHGGFLLYHFVILFFGVFPASLLALPAFRRGILKNEEKRPLVDQFRWMMISFWVVLILFTIVRTKIIHYSSFCYFPLTFFAAYMVNKWMNREEKLPRFVQIFLIFVASIFGIALTAVTLFDKFKHLLYPYVDDAYTLNSMKATASWVGFEPAVGVVLIICTILFCSKFRKRPTAKNLAILLSGSIFYVFTMMLLVVGQVEKYSQAPAVDFYVSKKGEECYIYPREKSYAHYFYSERKPENSSADFEYLSKGDIDKPCYFVIKNDPERVIPFITQIDNAEKLYELNGFVFFVRKPPLQIEDDE